MTLEKRVPASDALCLRRRIADSCEKTAHL
jgi:hypothetical protein